MRHLPAPGRRNVLSRIAWRALAAGLVSGSVLGAGEAAAQAICGDAPAAGQRIECTRATGDIVIDASGLAIAGGNTGAVLARQNGPGAISIDLTDVELSATGGGYPVRALASGGDLGIAVTRGALTASGVGSAGVHGGQSGAGRLVIDLDRVAIAASGDDIDGVYARHGGAGVTDIDITGGRITTADNDSDGRRRGHNAGVRYTGGGAATIDIDGGAVIEASGSQVFAVFAETRHPAARTVSVSVRDSRLSTTGHESHAIYVKGSGDGDVVVALDGASVTTTAEKSSGVQVHAWGDIDVDARRSAIATAGGSALGVQAVSFQGDVDIDVTGGSIAIADSGAIVYGHVDRGGDTDIDLRGVSAVGGGILGSHGGSGAVTLTTDAKTSVRSPFFTGVSGILLGSVWEDPNPAGRVVIAHGGAIEARETGILAGAARRSGHTFGAGAVDADDAARTEPMIHVTSSGNIAVGAGVTDAFVRAAVAGGDGVLSAGEKTVFAAILAADSGALDTALAGLPAAYDDAWKARARVLLANFGRAAARVDDGTSPYLEAARDDGTSPYLAAREILGLTLSGIRAEAIDYESLAYHVGGGDVAFGSNADAWGLSAAERTVLEAALTGGDLEAALAALPAGYTNEWKDDIRRRAANYNAGDIRIDITGGTVTAEGDGVDALYALAHDRNGAIAVTVAAGATVSGGRHGVRVRGAGRAAGGGPRDQTVTVNGAVTGGTGAGVFLPGGGVLAVGATGRAGAESGVGVLSEGAGDFRAVVAGSVEGDIRAPGAGAREVSVSGGGRVTGRIDLARGAIAVHGAAGQARFDGAGTVTVARTGRITGVAGDTDGIRSETGDLSVAVAGSVTGDIRAPGGALTLTMVSTGAVSGTVHDPSGRLAVSGSLGRLLYSGGATVTVAESGRLTGVEAGGAREAIRGGAGALDLTVAGRIAGLTDLTRTAAGNLFTIREGFVDGAVRFGAGDDHMRIEGRGYVSGDVAFGAGTDTLTLDVRDGREATGFGGSISGLERLFKRGGGVARVRDVALSGGALVLEDGGLNVAGHLNLGAAGVLTVHDGSRLVIEVGDVTADAAAHGRITAGGGVVYRGLPKEETPELYILVAADAAANREAIGTALQDGEAIAVLGEATGVMASRAGAGSEPVTVQAVLKTTGADNEARDAGVLSDDGKAEVRLAPNQALGVAEPPAGAPAGLPAPEARLAAGTPAAGGGGTGAAATRGAGGGSGGGLVVGGGALLAAFLFALLDGDEDAFAEWETEDSRRRTTVSFGGPDAGHFEELRVRTGGLERWTRVFAGGAPSVAGGAGGEVRGVAMGLDARLARGFHLGVSAMPALAVSSRAGAAPGFDTGLLGGRYAVRGGWSGGALFAGASFSHGDYRVDTVLANPAAGGAMGGAFDLVQNHARARAGARLDLGGGLRATPSAALFAGALRQGAWTARGGALRAETPVISQRYRGWEARLDVAPPEWRKGPAGLRWRPGAHLSVARAFTRGPAWVELAQSDAVGVLGFASRARVRELPRTAHAFGASLTVARSERWRFRAGYAGMTVDGEPVHAAAARLRMRF